MSDLIAPDAAAAGRSMSGWLKGVLLSVLAFTGSWGGAISYWRTSDRMPGNWELALLLVGLPVLVLFVFWLSRKLLVSRNGSSTAEVRADKQLAVAPASELPGLAILAASLRLPHGVSAEELAVALANKKARPDLDSELLDLDGLPVMAARSSDAVDEALQEEIAGWLDQNGMSTQDFSDEQWRALTLATAVTDELARCAAKDLRPQADNAPKLRLIPILPPEWSTEHRRAAGAWLKQKVAQSGWPDKEIALDEEVLANAAAPSVIFGHLARDSRADDAALAAIVVACASNVGNETIAHWAKKGRLFTPSNTKGAIPGEGAAGLLVSGLRHAPAQKENSCVLAVDEGRLASSADEAKRIDPELVRELAKRVLKRAGADFANVAKIVADTDHRSNRMIELMSAATNMPHLDEADDVVQVSVSTGSCGDVPFITALALAHHHVLALQSPVLAIGNQDAYRRVAALVTPAERPS